MDRYSLRWRLPLSYAGIALLAALASGVVLIFTLRGYYQRLERRYLEGNAAQVSLVAAKFLQAGVPLPMLQDQVQSWAFFMQARVQVLDASEHLLVDSGIPQVHQVMMISNPPEENAFFQAESQPGDVIMTARKPTTATLAVRQVYVFSSGGLVAGVQSKQRICPPDVIHCEPVMIRIERAPDGQRMTVPFTDTLAFSSTQDAPVVGVAMPLESSLYGFNLKQASGPEPQRSRQVVERPVIGAAGERLAVIRLSDGPAYGDEIVTSVLRGWMVAGTAAVILAALVGFLISQRLTAPLLALSQATAQMAGGDLAARAAVDSRDEFGQLAGSFNHMATQVEEIVQTLRNFISDAAHELHTPLTALRTYLELAGDEKDAARRTAHLAAASEQAARLQGVIDGLLDLSRLEGGRSVHVPLDLAAVVQGAAGACASRFEQLGLLLELQLPAQSVWVLGDAAQLRLALDNLLDNAGKFTLPGGQVQVRLQVVDGAAELRVADTGIGVPEEDRQDLFQRFHRGRNAAAYPGSGLGLAIVRSVVTTHQGEIFVQEAGLGAGPDELAAAPLAAPGAAFVLRFPLQ